MNQILYVNSDKKKGGPLELKMVLKIFAIAIIIFGVILVGKASFAMMNKKDVAKSIPDVEVTQQEKKLSLNITHDKLIDKIIYSWDDEKRETILQGKGRANVSEVIELPKVGNNTLNLKVIDIDGTEVTYSESYFLEAGDTIKPEIEILPDDKKIKIIAKDETEIDYIEFYWNDEDSTKKNASDTSKKIIEERIDGKKGENTLHVIAYDKAENRSEFEQVIKGATQPKITTTIEENNLVIVVEDKENIQKVDYVLNNSQFSTDPQNTGKPLDMIRVEIRQPLQSGKNKITIKAYNTNGLSSETTLEPEI